MVVFSKEDAGVIFSAALDVGMLDRGYFWLVSQSAAAVAPVGTWSRVVLSAAECTIVSDESFSQSVGQTIK